jgi:predicted XRE-type DNA-binding protein
MSTTFGDYLQKINVKQTVIANALGIDPKNISLLCTNDSRAIYADEFYRIIIVANKFANLDNSHFYKAIEEVFPDRPKKDLLSGFKSLSPEAQFFKKYTLRQKDIEKQLGIPGGKFSKFFSDPSKKALAIEIITFAEALKLDVLETFREIFGEVHFNEEVNTSEKY